MNSKPMAYSGFNTARCNVCTVTEWRATSKELRYCSGCHLIGYCGQHHQRQDWKMHKQFCGAVVRILKSQKLAHLSELFSIGEAFVGSTRNCRLYYSMHLVERLISLCLNRELQTHEFYMVRFPVVCKVCFLCDRQRLFRCTGCEQIFYCSTKHQEQDSAAHAKWCKQYRLNFILDNDYPNLHVVSQIPVLDDVNQGRFPKDTFEMLKFAFGSDFAEDDTNQNTIKIVSIYSYVGTILSILDAVSMMNRLHGLLCIYVVGAGKETMFFNNETCAILFTFLPSKVKTIALYFIGPDVLTYNKQESVVLKYDGERCVRFCYYRTLFHELTPVQTAIAPHLIVCFNCGFNEHVNRKDTWAPTLERLVDYVNIPLAFTSYTHEEAETDWKLVRDKQVRSGTSRELLTFKRVEVNAFKDYKPLRNTEVCDVRDEMYHENGYISIIINTVR